MFESQLFRQENSQLIRGNGIRHNYRAGSLFRDDHTQQCNQGIPVHFRTIGKDNRATVTVAIKNNAQVRSRVQRCFAGCFHSCRVFRVRDMIRENTIRIQINRTGNIRAQRFQNISGKESCRSISGVFHNVKARERSLIILRIDLPADHILHMRTINSAHIKRFRGNCSKRKAASGQQRFGIFFRKLIRKRSCRVQDPGQFRFRKSAIFCEKLHSVPVERQMTGGDHHSTVEIAFRQQCGLEHRGCRDQPTVICPGNRKTRQTRLLDLFRGHPAVMSDANPQFCRIFPALFRKKSRKSPGDKCHQRTG